MLMGYARVSTNSQDLTAKQDALRTLSTPRTPTLTTGSPALTDDQDPLKHSAPMTGPIGLVTTGIDLHWMDEQSTLRTTSPMPKTTDWTIVRQGPTWLAPTGRSGSSDSGFV